MKILYVGNDSPSSLLQLERFRARPKNFEVRYAGFNNSLSEIGVDYTLDPIGNSSRTGRVKRSNLDRYISEIAAYRPNLIINDFDFPTSYAATELGIPYWLASSTLLYFGMPKLMKQTIKIGQYFTNLFENFAYNHIYQITNADRLLMYSCLGDMSMCPELLPRFEWVRPYHIKASYSERQPAFIATLMETDKKFIKYLSNLGDTNLYSPFEYEKYKNINHLNILNNISYAEDLNQAYLCFNRGESSLVADAFYNEKYSLIYPNVKNIDTIINGHVFQYLKLAERIYTRESFDQINSLAQRDMNVKVRLDPGVKYLDEYIGEL